MTLVCEDFSQRKTTKKGDRRKTARRAYEDSAALKAWQTINTPRNSAREKRIIKRLESRTKRKITRSLSIVRKELDRLRRSGKIPDEDYNILRTCLDHYKEFMPTDSRYKI